MWKSKDISVKLMLFIITAIVAFMKSFQLLQNENENRHKKYGCDDCGKEFNRKFNLERHIETVHLNMFKKEHKCDICEKAFGRRDVLQRHVLLIHLSPKKFKCQKCDMSFANKENLKRHFESNHHENRPHVCDQCGKAFGHQCTLRVHMENVHENVKPFKCGICDKSFGQKGHLDRHVKAIHENSRPRPPVAKLPTENSNLRKCETCGKEFTGRNSKQSFDKHQKMHENQIKKLQKIKCDICNDEFKFKCHLDRHRINCEKRSKLLSGFK